MNKLEQTSEECISDQKISVVAPSQRVKDFSDLLDEEHTVKESFVIVKALEALTRKRAAEDAAKKREEAGLPPLEKADYEFGKMAYEFKLNDCTSTPRGSLDLAANSMGKDKEWVDKVRHQKWPHNKRITIEYSDKLSEFEHKDLIAGCVAEATTLNRGLTILDKFQEIDRSIKSMRQEIEKLKSDQRKAEVKQISMEMDINNLFASTGTKQLGAKEKAMVLKSKGFSIKAISKELNVHRNTVMNWLKGS